MTVAACILAASVDSALRDVEGTPNVRRIVDAAWAGGALPIVVVAPDPDGALAVALAGSPAVLAMQDPAPSSSVAHVCRAIDIAIGAVKATTAALVWPATFGWVDAETVTSLIEAHGTEPGVALRPAFEGSAGWPLLMPVDHLGTLRGLAAGPLPDAPADAHVEPLADALGEPLADVLAELLAGALGTGVPSRVVDLGDPGSTHPVEVGRAALPPFAGPPEPPAEQRHDWGSAAAAPPAVPGPEGVLE